MSALPQIMRGKKDREEEETSSQELNWLKEKGDRVHQRGRKASEKSMRWREKNEKRAQTKKRDNGGSRSSDLGH